MIYPSQETEIKNFLDDLLEEHNRAVVKGNDIRPTCEIVETLMERAENLRAKLGLWAIIPEEEAVRAGNR